MICSRFFYVKTKGGELLKKGMKRWLSGVPAAVMVEISFLFYDRIKVVKKG